MSIDLAHSSAVIESGSDCPISPAYEDMEKRAVIYPKRKEAPQAEYMKKDVSLGGKGGGKGSRGCKVREQRDQIKEYMGGGGVRALRGQNVSESEVDMEEQSTWRACQWNTESRLQH